MHPKFVKRRVHSAEFKAKVLAECRQPGASVSGVAIGHGLNPNVVRKWLAGLDLKRMGGGSAPDVLVATRKVQFLPVELTGNAQPSGAQQPAGDDVHVDVRRGALHVKLHCPANAAVGYAAALRTLADVIGC